MNKENPFTKQEKKISDYLLKAHKEFMKLSQNHPDEMDEWKVSFHRLQCLLIHRIVCRDYPNIFHTTQKIKENE